MLKLIHLSSRLETQRLVEQGETIKLEVCVLECHFPGTGFFPEKSGEFLVPSIQEDPLSVPVSVPPFGTGQFLSRLSHKNETGIPEFEISGKIPEIWYWTGNFLLGTEICYINQDK